MNKFLATSLLLISAISFAQSEGENQCRLQAKEIALKTYQGCVSESRSLKIDQIRKEYQEKLNDLKKEYEVQLQNVSAPAVNMTPSSLNSPIDESSGPILKSEKIEKQDLEAPISSNQPSIVLKPAPQKGKAIGTAVAPRKAIIATKRMKGEKGVKGIAKTLPVKQKTVLTKPVSQMITGNELKKSAPVSHPELEKNQVSQSPSMEQNETTGETENLQMIDPSLPATAASSQE